MTKIICSYCRTNLKDGRPFSGCGDSWTHDECIDKREAEKRVASPFNVVILFANGSWGIHDFKSFVDARDFYRNSICYSDRVQRVTVMENGNQLRAVWDSSWDDQSKYAGLNN